MDKARDGVDNVDDTEEGASGRPTKGTKSRSGLAIKKSAKYKVSLDLLP